MSDKKCETVRCEEKKEKKQWKEYGISRILRIGKPRQTAYAWNARKEPCYVPLGFVVESG